MDNAKVQAALIADAKQMRIIELVEVYDSSQFGDPRNPDDVLFICSGSVNVKAVLVSK